MAPKYLHKPTSPTIRVTLGLVSLSASLMLAGWTCGLVPDEYAARLRGRGDFCEALAICLTRMADTRDVASMEACVRAVSERNGDLTSISVWEESGELLVHAGEGAADKGPANGRSTDSLVVVPIFSGSAQWGRVVAHFTPLTRFGLPRPFGSPFVLFLVCVTAAQLLAFAGYLKRIFVYLNPTRVVPGRVRSALDSLAEGLLLADRDGQIVLANQAFAETAGKTPEELVGTKVDALSWIGPKDPDTARDASGRAWLQTLVDGKPRYGELVGFRSAAAKECTFVVNVTPIHDDTGRQQGVLASFQDITLLEERTTELQSAVTRLQESAEQIRRQNRQLEYMATRDALTGCWNRRWFLERFDELWSEATHRQLALSCVMVDVDHFKKVNDTRGHLAGDQVLKQVAESLRNNARTGDLVARYGGEEFAVLMPHTDVAEAAAQAEVLRRAISELELPGFRVTASLGVSAFHLGAESPQHLLDQADKCLYAAKRNGRNQVVRFDTVPAEQLVPEAATERDAAASRIPYRSVTALTTALAYRHPRTAEHSRRVADYCLQAAEGVLSSSRCYVLELAALLHDIGKVGVPDTLLDKSDPLTPDELETIRRHDQIGVEIVNAAFADQSLTSIIEGHILRFAGQPLDTPVEARILAVADAYDMIVTGGGYRPARTPREAFRELRRAAGTQFDPAIVESFIDRITRGIREASELDALRAPTQETALDLGLQIERLMAALDEKDMRGLANLAGGLKLSAQGRRVPLVAAKAGQLEQLVRDGDDLIEILKTTNELAALSRAAQQRFTEAPAAACPAEGLSPRDDTRS